MHDQLIDFRMALFAGDFEKAERLAQAQLARAGDSPRWLNELGQVYLAQGRFSEALQHFDKASHLDAGCVEALLNGAIVLSDLGFYDEAASRFAAATAADADHVSEEQAHAAGVEDDGKDPWQESGPRGGADAPRASAARAVAEKYFELGELYMSLSHWSHAAEAFEASLTMRDSFVHRMAHGRALMHMRAYDRALETLEMARRLEPRNASVHVRAAVCYFQLGRRPEAAESLQRAELLGDASVEGSALRATFKLTPSPLPG